MKKIFAILLFLTASMVFSQEMLVPFRIGDKFGLSDINGKMKLDAVYDDIDAEKDNMFSFKKGASSGVISGGKEILSLPDHYKYDAIKDKFIITSIKRNDPASHRKFELKELYSFKGQKLIVESLSYLKVVESFGGTAEDKNNIFIFRGLSPDKAETLYVYDSSKQKVTDKLFANSKRINVVDKDFTTKEVFVAVISQDGNQEKYVLDLKGGKVKSSPANGRAFKGSARSNEKEIQVVEIKPGDDMDLDVTVAMPSISNEDLVPTKIKYYNSSLTIENKSVVVTYKSYYSGKELTAKKVNLPENSTDIKAERWIQTFTGQGKSHNSYNYVTYSVDGKKGLFITDTIQIKPKYDVLTPVRFKHNGSTLFTIIVGNKDASGVVKYGIINDKEEILTPIIYDKIEYSLDEQYSAGQSVKTAKDYLLVKRNNLYGIINCKNKEILQVKYSDITVKSNSYMMTYILRKDGKYGIYKVEMERMTEFADAFFPMPVAGIIEDFAGVKGTSMIILEKDDKFFCYARPDGFLYYKS